MRDGENTHTNRSSPLYVEIESFIYMYRHLYAGGRFFLQASSLQLSSFLLPGIIHTVSATLTWNIYTYFGPQKHRNANSELLYHSNKLVNYSDSEFLDNLSFCALHRP